MEYREWRDVVNKSSWDRGEWDNEADKVQWQDEATGLPCLIVRNGTVTGSLCGYVGVPKNHPAFGLSYDGCTQEAHDAHFKAALKNCGKPDEEREKVPPAPIVMPTGQKIMGMEVHGGLTFSGACDEPTEETFRAMQRQLDSHRKVAERHPKGDSAKWLETWAWCLNDFEDWKNFQQSRSLCHIADDGPVWWFGFDCAHYLDIQPAMVAFRREHGLPEFRVVWPDGELREHYRNIAYVKAECEHLAKQLKTMMPPQQLLLGAK